MPRQHQLRIRGKDRQRAGTCQPFRQRIGLGFRGVDPDIGGNSGQKLISADDQIIIQAPERRMVRGMALSLIHI